MRKGKKKVVIIGAGGFARELLWVFRDSNEDKKRWDILGFVDDNTEKHGQIICDMPVLGGIDWLKGQNYNDFFVINSIAIPRSKKDLINRVKEWNIKFCSVIHPSVKMSKYIEIGEGTVITAGNILTTQIKIGNHVILNLDCTVGHDSIIEDFCTIAPGSHISGTVIINEGVDFGTGAVIIQDLNLGEWSIIGAGAVVTKNIPANKLAIGIPAKVIKEI